MGAESGVVTIDPNNLQNLVQRKVFDDPSEGMIQGRFIRQFVEILSRTDLDEDQKSAVLELLIVVGLKFVSVWMHDHRYGQIEQKLVDDAVSNPVDLRKNQPMRISTAQELYIEFDGFLVQCKSVLDHMVNVLHYTFNLNFSSLSTFGNKGNTIINLLKRNVGGDRGKKEMAKILIEHIETNQGWLGGLIDARDRMNHFMHGGISPQHFAVSFVIDKEGKEELHHPMMNTEQSVKQVMTMMFQNVMNFVEYFLGRALQVRMVNHGLQFNRQDDPKVPHWDVFYSNNLEELIASGKVKLKE
jgi:hypothetical protein